MNVNECVFNYTHLMCTRVVMLATLQPNLKLTRPMLITRQHDAKIMALIYYRYNDFMSQLDELYDINIRNVHGFNLLHCFVSRYLRESYFINTNINDTLDLENIIVTLCSKGVDVNAFNNFKETPLHYCYNASYKVLHAFKTHGAIPNLVNEYGETILIKVAKYGTYSTMRALLSIFDDININARDIYGRNALHVICDNIRINEEEEMIKLLIEKGINTTIRDNRQHSPLYYALHNKNINICNLISK